MKEVFDASINPKQLTGADLLNAPIIALPLAHIFNLTLVSGNIPKVWKAAHVLPLHKGSDTSDPNNYRPISKLPSLAKILERLIHSQL